MTDKMRKKMESLRAITPRLNKATDAAAATLKAVDEFLAELGVGVPAASSAFKQWPVEAAERGGTPNLGQYSLAYDRTHFCSNRFCIHVLEQTFTTDGNGQIDDLIDETQHNWASFSRADKLKAFAELPSLIDSIASEATRIAERAEKAEATVRETMAALGSGPDEDDGEDASGPAARALIRHLGGCRTEYGVSLSYLWRAAGMPLSWTPEIWAEKASGLIEAYTEYSMGIDPPWTAGPKVQADSIGARTGGVLYVWHGEDGSGPDEWFHGDIATEHKVIGLTYALSLDSVILKDSVRKVLGKDA
jgi:hypothetical protein